MSVITLRGIALAVGITGLVGAASPAAADVATVDYVPPFERAEAEFSPPCSGPGCQGEAHASADIGGTLAAEAELTSAGSGPGMVAFGSVVLTHAIERPASEVSISATVDVASAFVKVIGGPGAEGKASVTLIASHRNRPSATTADFHPVAVAQAPIQELSVEDERVELSATMRTAQPIPAGIIDITIYLEVAATTIPPHGPAMAGQCFANCVGVGQVEARVSGSVEGVKVEELR